jgi:hypothetical protein
MDNLIDPKTPREDVQKENDNDETWNDPWYHWSRKVIDPKTPREDVQREHDGLKVKYDAKQISEEELAHLNYCKWWLSPDEVKEKMAHRAALCLKYDNDPEWDDYLYHFYRKITLEYYGAFPFFHVATAPDGELVGRYPK